MSQFFLEQRQVIAMPVTGRVTSSHGYTDEACESSGSPAIMEHDVLLFRPVTLRPGFSVQFALVQKISTCDAHLIYTHIGEVVGYFRDF
jgi:hypothetical protein